MSAAVVPDEIYQSQTPQTTEVAVAEVRDVRGRFGPGNQPRNPGGRPKKLREIERMLNVKHRTAQNMSEVFDRLRALAMGEAIIVPVFTEGGELKLECKLTADARFMQLYLDRLLGPAKAFEDDFDLSDAPSEVIEYLRVRVSR